MGKKLRFQIQTDLSTTIWINIFIDITWFPEPLDNDDIRAEIGEHTLDWLKRSTLSRAKS